MKQFSLLAFLLIFLIGCDSTSDSSTTSDSDSKPETVEKKEKNEYPADVVQTFMNSCEANSGGRTKVCACMLEKIQEKYTLEEFSTLEVKMQAGKTPEEFLEFIGKIRLDCQ